MSQFIFPDNTKPPIALILAGSDSTHLWPLAEKSLLRFAGATLLQRHLDALAQLGLEEVIIVASSANIKDARAEARAWQKRRPNRIAEVVEQPAPLGMGDAILKAKDALNRREGWPIYVTTAHDVVDPRLHIAILKAYCRRDAHSYLAGHRQTDYFPGGYMVVDAHRRITRIVEKPGIDNKPSDLVNIVAHLHTMPQGLLEEIEKAYQTRPVDAHFDHYEFAMDVQMNKQDLTYRVVAYDGPWKPIKYPWHVLDVMDYFLGQIDRPHISSQAVVMDNVRIDGDVVIEAGAHVFNGASIVGPAYIGAGSTVGDGALVRESMIGKGCSVGHTSEVARSYLADGCELHRAVVLDSVFDASVNFSAGCITANLRWDRNEVKSTVDGDRLLTGRRKFGAVVGRNAFISIQSGTMPGVKIGRDAVVGPFTNVMHDVPDGALLYAEQKGTQRLRDADAD